MKTGNRQRENRRRKEERPGRRDACGVPDPTPFEAVENIRRRERA